jgi:hypothetical protein
MIEYMASTGKETMEGLMVSQELTVKSEVPPPS